MARDTTPSGRKRPRHNESEDVSISSSHKKRRLNSGSASAAQSTPKGLHAIASAISGALGFGRRSASSVFHSSNKEDIDTYEVPDSDEERQTKVKTATKESTKKQASSGRKPSQARQATYDVPDSEDEVSVVSPSQRSQPRVSNPPSRRTASGNATKSGSARRTRKYIEKEEKEKEADSQHEEDQEMLETPSKRYSGRKSRSNPPPDTEVVDLLEPADEIVMEDTTPAAAKSSGRKRRNPLDDLVIDGTPKLKGILTPSKRHQETSRPRKSVAFDRDAERGREEVFFADLPSKAGKTKRGPKPAQKAEPAEDEPEAEAEEAAEDVDDEDDEEVCAICSKPDSEPPNEIILCDNCDFAVHQDCYGVPVIPEGDWLCRSCSQEDIGPGLASGGASGKTNGFVEEKTPDIPNFEHHLRALQRVLLDRCTGSRRIPLRGQDEAYEKAFQLIQQTVAAGEGNSMLIIGARGCGKTTLVESIISNISKDHKDEFHVVRLNGFIHTDDKLALKEIWRQLGKEMEVEDDLVSKPSNYADILASLLALLSHPSEISEAQQSVTSKSVVFVIDEFDLFATHARQTLLYNLFDIAQSRKAPIAVVGLTTRVDVVESLEKRVKSRFSHRYVYLSLPKSLPAYWDICKQGLTVEDEDLEDAGLDAAVEGHSQFQQWWNKKIDALYKDALFQDHLEFHFYRSKSASAFLTTCILPLSHLSPTSLSMKIPSGPSLLPSLEAPDSKLHLLESLSDLDLAMLIAAARLDIVAHTDTVNFAMAYDEYTSLMGKQRVQSASAGMLAVGAGSRVWGRGAAGMAWERLASLSLLIPAGVGGRAASSHGGLEAKMWKVDVALEEIPAAVKLNAVLARWCKEI